MQNYKIPRSEILKLYESSLKEISTHSINQWLKVNTDNKFIVIPIEILNKINEELDKINLYQ